MGKHRTEVQNEVVEALISSKAVDFEAMGTVLSKFGARAALKGDAIGAIINWRMLDLCIPPEPYRLADLEQAVGAQVKG